jgi:NADPH-dependent ferric siderophore reductase
MHSVSPARRVQRVRHELRRRDVEVRHVTQPSHGFVEITFQGESLADFVSASFDDHVKFLLEDGRGEPVGRDYTPRRFDLAQRELTIEFAVQGHDGPASAWARQARPGQRAVIGGPRGSMIIPADYEWHLLAGDETALPAVCRRLEELPQGAQAIVVLQVDPADRRELRSQARLDVNWVLDAQEFLATMSALALPAGEGFAWAAGEARTMASARRILAEEKGVAKEAMRVAAYWKQGASAHHENLEA